MPREGHDYAREWANRMFLISIHVPREGHDLMVLLLVFLVLNFNPRAPRGARPLRFAFQMQRFMISIHVPREGHDFDVL